MEDPENPAVRIGVPDTSLRKQRSDSGESHAVANDNVPSNDNDTTDNDDPSPHDHVYIDGGIYVSGCICLEPGWYLGSYGRV